MTGTGVFTLPYSGKHKKSSAYDYPKFGLTKKDEKGIIMIIDPEPTCAFVHWVITGTRLDRNTKLPMLAGAYYLCSGRQDKLLAEECDPEVCPLCRAAEDIEDAPVGTARFKACTHIIHYATTPMGQFANPVGHPPMFQLKVWVFGQQVYNHLADKKDQWGSDTFRHHDLQVTCISPQYRNYTIDILPKTAWLEPAFTQFGEDKKPKSGLAIMVVQLYQQAKLKNLGPVLGRSASDEEADKLASKAKSIVSETNVGVGQTPAQVETALNTGTPEPAAPAPNIDDLFGSSTETHPEPSVGPPDVVNPAASTQAAPPVQTQVEGAAPVADQPVVASPITETEEVDFDKLLEG